MFAHSSLMSGIRNLERDMNEPLWSKQWMFVQVCLSEKGRGRGGICRAPLSFTRRRPPQLMHQNRDNDPTEHPAGFSLALSVPPTRDSRPICLCLSFFPSHPHPPPLLKGFICARRPSGRPPDRSSIFSQRSITNQRCFRLRNLG